MSTIITRKQELHTASVLFARPGSVKLGKTVKDTSRILYFLSIVGVCVVLLRLNIADQTNTLTSFVDMLLK